MQQLGVLIYSGGMDSFTLLHDMLDHGIKVHAISVDYNQRHSKELDCATKVCKAMMVPHHIVNLKDLGTLLCGNALTDPGVAMPHGHYEDENMKLTVVPNRNMIILSIALGYAASIGCQEVYYGAHSGDHAIYPDCRPEFIEAMKAPAALCHYEPIRILAPYEHMTKANIVMVGKSLDLDYSNTWTCYEGREKACGKCGSCQERLEAFRLSNMVDPVNYF